MHLIVRNTAFYYLTLRAFFGNMPHPGVVERNWVTRDLRATNEVLSLVSWFFYILRLGFLRLYRLNPNS